MDEVITRIDRVEEKIVSKLDNLAGCFDKQEETQLRLYNLNKERLDNLVKSTNFMKKEYREKFVKIENRISAIGIALVVLYLVNIFINIF